MMGWPDKILIFELILSVDGLKLGGKLELFNWRTAKSLKSIMHFQTLNKDKYIVRFQN
jgi:hypothetical protein